MGLSIISSKASMSEMDAGMESSGSAAPRVWRLINSAVPATFNVLERRLKLWFSTLPLINSLSAGVKVIN